MENLRFHPEEEGKEVDSEGKRLVVKYMCALPQDSTELVSAGQTEQAARKLLNSSDPLSQSWVMCM